MVTREERIKNRIMRRVYGIWFVRRVAPMGFASAFFINLALKEAAGQFFVAQIVSNFLTVAGANLWGIPRFIASALNSAEPSVLVLISATGMVGFTLAVKLWRSIKGVAAAPSMAAVPIER